MKTTRISSKKMSVLTGVLAGALAVQGAWSAERASPPPAADPNVEAGAAETVSGSGAEEVQIEKIKQKYWAGGDEAQVGVVQNRAFSKAHKWALGAQGGFLFNDPFLDNKVVGGTVGYHFSEYLGLEFMGWKVLSKNSSAADTAAGGTNPKVFNTNIPSSYLGTEVLWSVMYGKLSLVGKKIIYYDMHLIGGVGMASTENGKYASGLVGLGQRFYIGKSTSLRVDYRFIGYQESIKEKETPSLRGQDRGKRFNAGHSLVLGIDFMFGGGKR